MMDWIFVKPLESEKLISDFEHLVQYNFPESFKECVRQYNGGIPDFSGFDTNKSEGREIKGLLSFNMKDKETVWKINEWSKEELSDHYVAFAIDNFGNLICFDTHNDGIIFLNLEDLSVEMIADSFVEFLSLLYE